MGLGLKKRFQKIQINQNFSEMAAFSSGTPGAVPDTRVDDLDRLSERAIEANAVSRDALAAKLFSRAEALAMQLHDNNSLVPAWLRF